nr:putative RNA-dependent RNA polymerase [Rhizoctonia solani mitovirus 112]
MKNNIFNIFKHFGRLPINMSENFNAMLGVKARPLLRKILLGVSSVCGVRVSKTKLSSVTYMINKLIKIRKHRGLKGLTLYLKASFVLYQQSLGGQVLPDTAPVAGPRVSRTNRGLPRLIPSSLRREIGFGNVNTMKLVSSVLNLFRDIKYPGTPKLSTIISPYVGKVDAPASLQEFIVPFLSAFLSFNLLSREIEYNGSVSLSRIQALAKEAIQWRGRRLFMIWKAAPGMVKDTLFGTANYSSHPFNVFRSLLSLFKNEEIWNSFTFIADFIEHRALKELLKIFTNYKLSSLPYTGAIGKLHAKEEPAGKVRLFAMVDAPTQWVLYPLHEFIMEQLRGIPQDGTFNQTKPLGALVGSKELYSYDLTAATDRLPITLQVRILSVLFGGRFAEAWSTLLVNRSYGFRQMGYDKWHGTYKYAVGQPMGAYSSWAMLALTHHFLVQVSAWRSGITPVGSWFKDYAVLGDDLVLANGPVAREYLALLAELGMPVNLQKSLVSKDGSTMEFAKRTLWHGKDISPVPIKEMDASQGLVTAMVGFAIKYSLNLPQLLAAFQMGWRNISWLSKPLNKLPSQIRTLVLAMSMPKSFEDLPKFFELGSRKAKDTVVDLVAVGEAFKTQTVPLLVAKIQRRLDEVAKVEPFKDDLIDQIEKAFPKSLGLKLLEKGLLTMEDISIRGETFILVPNQKDIEERLDVVVSAKFTDTQKTGLHVFFFVLFHLLYGRYLSDYGHVVRLVLADMRGLAGVLDILPNSVFLDSPKLIISQSLEEHGELYGFFHRYWDVLKALEEMAMISPAVLEFERPEGSEGISADYNTVTPVHLRYYRMWSGVLQGNNPLMNLGVKPNLIKPNGIMPSEATGQEPGVWN